MLSTEAGPSTEQMHENRPTSVSEGQNEEVESSSSHNTVTDSPDSASAGRNKFPEYLQSSKSANGREKQKRDWLTYIPSMDALYCVPCMLFSHDDLRKASM